MAIESALYKAMAAAVLAWRRNSKELRRSRFSPTITRMKKHWYRLCNGRILLSWETCAPFAILPRLEFWWEPTGYEPMLLVIGWLGGAIDITLRRPRGGTDRVGDWQQ